MPITSAAIVVGQTATVVSQPELNSKYIYLQSGTEGALTYAGGPNVTASNGILLSETSPTVFETRANDTLYCISDTAGATVKVLEVK